jgi:hypothetical protein
MRSIYESHITISGLPEISFREKCISLGVKPIHIVNDTGSNGLPKLMTGFFHKDKTESQAFREMWVASIKFGDKYVIRRKLELILGRNQKPPKHHQYLEFHLKYIVPHYNVSNFLNEVQLLGGHTSRNYYKPTDSHGNYFVFVTARSEELSWKLQQNLSNKYALANLIRECVIYDDNPSIDTVWNCMECPIKRGKAYVE